MSETKFNKFKKLFNSNEIHDLVFDEIPYKVYSAKVSGKPNLKYMCFEKNGMRYYSGNATINFTCFHPYARTPKLAQKSAIEQSIIVRYKGIKIFTESSVKLLCGLFFRKYEDISFNGFSYSCIDNIELICLDESGKSFVKKITNENLTLDEDTYIEYIQYNFKTTLSNINDAGKTFTFSPYITSDNKLTKYSYCQLDGTQEKCYLCFLSSSESLLGKCVNCYNVIDYPNKKQWCWASGLPGGTSRFNNGEVSSPFVVTVKNNTANNISTTIKVENENNEPWGKISFVAPAYSTIIWDSRLGLLKQILDGKEKVLAYSGVIWGYIPKGQQAILKYEADKTGIEVQLEYNYWYY